MTPETLVVYSVEGFLTHDEVKAILDEVEAALHGRDQEFDAANRVVSVHEIVGMSVRETVGVFEPQSRLEFDELPTAAAEILSRAVQRRLTDIRRAYPSVTGGADWFYVEYGEGQYITPHIDYPVYDAEPEKVKCSGISVVLRDCEEGGDFCVETTADPKLWKNGRARVGADAHSPWFGDMARTRWRCHPAVGDAVCYGTQLVHSTLPVVRGRICKVIGFLTQ
jgi:hypothetical protein